MSPEFAFGPTLINALIGGIGTLAFAAGAAAVAVPRIAERIIPRVRDDALRDFLPFERIDDDGQTVICKDGSLMACLEIGGTDVTFTTPGDQEAQFYVRKRLFDSIADTKATLRIITTRRRIPVPKDPDLPHPVLMEVARRWHKTFRSAYYNTTVVMITVPGKGSLPKEALAEVVERVRIGLLQLRPARLSRDPATSHSGHLTLTGFLGQLTAPLSQPAPQGTGDYLSSALSADAVEFDNDGGIVFDDGRSKLYASVITLRKLGDHIADTLVDDILSIDGECTVVHVIQPLERMTATAVMKQQQKMMATTHFSSEISDQYQAAIEIVEGLDDARGSMAYYAFAVIAYGETQDELKETETLVKRALVQAGMTPVRERAAAQPNWWMSFPTYELWPRVYRFLSHNIAHMVTFNRPCYGAESSAWGPGAITYYRTPQRTAFAHQFHVSAQSTVAHSLIMAPTGAGKTTLFEFNCAMAMRHRNLRTYFFDRFQGTYIWVTALGGKYLNFNSDRLPYSEDTALNPLQCEFNPENAAFLRTWLATITGCGDAESLDQIAKAVIIAFSTPKQHRSLAALYKGGAFSGGTKLYQELRRWVDPDQYGPLFNAEHDTLDVESNRLIAFDMTQLFNDPILAPAVTSYLMFRVAKTARERREPFNVFMDETEPMIRALEFRKQFIIALQEYRKLGGAVAATFQRPEALTANNVAEAVRGQCQSWYLFPSPGADRNEYDRAGLTLTDAEWDFIKGRSAISRSISRGVLLKRPEMRESTVLDIDLSPLGEYLRLLSSENRDVGIAAEMQRKHGKSWIQHYLDIISPPARSSS